LPKICAQHPRPDGGQIDGDFAPRPDGGRIDGDFAPRPDGAELAKGSYDGDFAPRTKPKVPSSVYFVRRAVYFVREA